MIRKVDYKNIDDSTEWVFGMTASDEPDLLMVEKKRNLLPLYFVSVFILILLIFLIRIIYLNFFVDNNLFREQSELNFKRVFKEKALRGVIYDRKGKQLVQNIPTNHLALIPADISKDAKIRTNLFAKLSREISIPYSDLLNFYESNKFSFKPLVVKKNISHDQEIKIISEFQDVSGILIKKDFKRDYLFPNENAHLLGYLGTIGESDYAENEDIYSKDSSVGKMGIEAYFEEKLRGEDGEKTVLVDSKGKLISEISFSKPKSGGDLHLTIDNDLQLLSYRALDKGLKRAKSMAGTAIVENPNTGEVLAMVSLPTYDPNVFSKSISGKEWNDLMNKPNFPFLNRAISGIYPPGSVFKLVTATAVLEEKIIGADQKLNSPGTIQIIDKFDPRKSYIYKDWKLDGHGLLNIKQALTESSDTFFYQVTGGYQDLKGLGIQKFVEYCAKFYTGELLNIDLPGEKKGILPTPEWKLQERGAGWYTGDTYNMSIGQGYLLLTPLQVTNFTAIVANGGYFMRPHLNLADTDKIEKVKLFSDENLKIVREGLRMVITDKKGTAQSLKSLKVEVAGKTGTAQFETGKREHAWFTAFAPYINPEIVVTVLIEESGEGSAFAAPVAKEIIEGYFNK